MKVLDIFQWNLGVCGPDDMQDDAVAEERGRLCLDFACDVEARCKAERKHIPT